MALKIKISDAIRSALLRSLLNIEGVDSLYIRVIRYSGEGSYCNFLVKYFDFDKVNTSEDLITIPALNFPEKVYSFKVAEDGGILDYNVRKQAYEYLKTLPEFEGCEDY